MAPIPPPVAQVASLSARSPVKPPVHPSSPALERPAPEAYETLSDGEVSFASVAPPPPGPPPAPSGPRVQKRAGARPSSRPTPPRQPTAPKIASAPPPAPHPLSDPEIRVSIDEED